MNTQTVNTAEYKIFSWKNPNPPPPCGKLCPFFDFWKEDQES